MAQPRQQWRIELAITLAQRQMDRNPSPEKLVKRCSSMAKINTLHFRIRLLCSLAILILLSKCGPDLTPQVEEAWANRAIFSLAAAMVLVPQINGFLLLAAVIWN